MIDEKKLIHDLFHDDGMDFTVKLESTTPESLGNCFQEFLNRMKEGMVSLINRQPKIHHKSEWISTKDRLPNQFESVLINIPGDSPLPTVHEGYLSPESIWISMTFKEAYIMEEVPFWMPMPEPPKGGESQ